MWDLLSQLFLDTDYDDHELDQFAASIAQAQYSVQQVENILFNEVYPVCGPNLQDPAGEWMGFPIAWLEDKIVALPDRPPGRFRSWWRRRVFERCRGDWWARIRTHLLAESAAAGETTRKQNGPCNSPPS